MTTIVVNATAIKAGGALTVLNEFIARADDSRNYIIFVRSDLEKLSHGNNIRLVRIERTRGFSRVWWDFCGLSLWLIKEKIFIDHLVSLQNMGVKGFGLRGKKQVIVYHQAIPLIGKKWSFLSRRTRSLAFYKYIYPFFVRFLDSESADYIVQAEWVKLKLHEVVGIPLARISVVKPSLIIDKEWVCPVALTQNKITFFYPAADFHYKNHLILVLAAKKLKSDLPHIASRIKIVLTLGLESSTAIEVQRCGVESMFEFKGQVPRREVLGYFKSGSFLLFPSMVETVGLPLLEAAYFSCSIIASDCPYSREVLDGASNVKFVSGESVQEWSDALANSVKE